MHFHCVSPPFVGFATVALADNYYGCSSLALSCNSPFHTCIQVLEMTRLGERNSHWGVPASVFLPTHPLDKSLLGEPFQDCAYPIIPQKTLPGTPQGPGDGVHMPTLAGTQAPTRAAALPRVLFRGRVGCPGL